MRSSETHRCMSRCEAGVNETTLHFLVAISRMSSALHCVSAWLLILSGRATSITSTRRPRLRGGSDRSAPMSTTTHSPPRSGTAMMRPCKCD